ncbi:MAG: hypothetical protein IIC92_08565, partial [Chloroflexi bacterium]|nr:hypothetical protein [Chloroflexota bacterium]
MTNERMQRRLERLLDRIDAAEEDEDWRSVQLIAESVLEIDLENAEATAYLSTARRWLTSNEPPASSENVQTIVSADASAAPPLPAGESLPRTRYGGEGEGEDRPVTASDYVPTSFASGRYQVSKFLGEGGKKRVYQAH